MIARKHCDQVAGWNARSALSFGCLVLGMAALLVACSVSPRSANPNLLCFTEATGVPYDSDPPNIDGVVAGDLGWTNAFRYVFPNGGFAPTVMQGIRDSSNLYLSFEVNGDASWDNQDSILLVFSPDGTPANDRRLLIFPVSDTVGAGAGSSPPREVRYWTDSSNWNMNPNAGNPVLNPSWLSAKVTSIDGGATSKAWFVELGIPITTAASTNASADMGINLPATGNFGLYVNVIPVQKSGGATIGPATQRTWPPNKPLTGGTGSTLLPQRNTPPSSDWGSGTRGGTLCNGITFDWTDITTNNTPNTQINIPGGGGSNVFSVKLHNYSVNASGSPVATGQVSARFKIANFGLPSAWTDLPAPGNPASISTVPAGTAVSGLINGGTATLSTGSWLLLGSDLTKYDTDATRHQCILVELDSSDPNTLFVNRSTWTNMEFKKTSSPFDGIATLGAQGYKLPEGASEHEFILTAYTYNTPFDAKWDTQIKEVSQIDQQQYMLKVKPEGEAPLVTQVTPPEIEIPNVTVDLKPGAGGDNNTMVTLQVKPGDLITLLAEGSVQLRNTKEPPFADPVGPNGIMLPVQFADQKFRLAKQFGPSSAAGALIGSWDGFRENSFLIGSARTVKVPAKADSLTLSINDYPEGYKEHSGQGFSVQVIETPLEPYYAFVDSIVTRDPMFENLPIQTGANLPIWTLCGQRKTGQILEIDGVKFDLVEDVGCYGYIVYSIGKK
jgi:hypothetical protein